MEKNIEEIINVSDYLYKNKLVAGKAGNVSARFKGEDGDVVAITPTLKSLYELNEEDIVLVDLEGNLLTKGKPSSEVGLHLEIYKKRSDVNGIVHTHSPYATGFAFSSKRIKRHEGFGAINTPFLEDIEYEAPGSMKLAKSASKAINTPFLEDIEYEAPGSMKLAKSASKAIGDEDVLILKQHGVLCVGDSLKEATLLATFVEETAKTQFITYMLNSTEDLI